MSRAKAGLIILGALLVASTLLSGCTGVSLGSDPWPPSQTGRPTFYYFGDPG
jgi:hypothetical protein